jgi:HEAT repeat protein
MGPAAKEAAPALAGLLTHADPDVRFRAARALGAVGVVPSGALADLVKIFEQDPRFVWLDPDCDVNRQQKPPPWVPYHARGWVSAALLGMGADAAPALRAGARDARSSGAALAMASALAAMGSDGKETDAMLSEKLASFGSPQGVGEWVGLVSRELPPGRARVILEAGSKTGNDRKRQIVRDAIEALDGGND